MLFLDNFHARCLFVSHIKITATRTPFVSELRLSIICLKMGAKAPIFKQSLLLKINPDFFALIAFEVVGVGSLHDLIVGPMGLAHIGESLQFVTMVIHKVFVCTPIEHSVDDGGNCRAGNDTLRSKSTVGIPVNTAILDGADHRIVVPRIFRNIAKDIFVVFRQINKTHGDNGKLRSGDWAFRSILISANTDHNPHRSQGVDSLAVPGSVGDIVKADSGRYLFIQQ